MQQLKNKSSFLTYFILTTIFITINIVLKTFILDFIIPQKILPENAVINFLEIHNTGAAFSILTSHILLLIGISCSILICLILLVIFYNKLFSKTEITALSLLSAGVFSNLYERITLKYVIDYIQLNFINFPIFNFADTMIVIGTSIYVYILLRDKENG